ncbi:uncharacterized protein LOC116426879 isoform X1 [Nomia melanderi]|uniref:uncharacterized protein LOC116426879 isoform X1 n=1 Tax=Nomia melanderi TaxID=2448451 RepID=UPI0013041A91|nr:uncharacterized protein LOC116426879 isoform X1 [Nomia melanderi]
MEENLMLILGENCVEVSKEKLANKSRYFASLFSHNFADSHNKQHIINYDIALSTLQNFIEWTPDDQERVDIQCHSIKSSMTKFVKDNFEDLLNLLELSVLFIVDELISDIEDIIILFWLEPEKVIDIWLLAQELGLKVLQGICISICLDRFEELPLSLLLKLTKNNITQLLQNVNVRASNKYLHFVRDKWMLHHMISDIPDIKDERKPKFIRTMVVHKLPESANTGEYLYLWNGDVFSECMQVSSVQGPQKGLSGMGTTGRGFSLYTAGGEMGIGNGKISNSIWRYCLISKKWFHYAKMPQPKRHMVIVFIGNQLLIVGGVGKNRIKSTAMYSLNIHKGTWCHGPTLPCCFTEVPPHCVMNGKLFLITSDVYVYDPRAEWWIKIMSDIPIVIDACFTPNTTLFQTPDTNFFQSDKHRDKTTLSRIDVMRESVCEKKDCSRRHLNSLPNNPIYCTHKSKYNYGCQLSYAKVAGIGVMLMQYPHDEEYKYLHSHTESRRDSVNFTIPRGGGSFQIIDPDTLYDTV